MKRLLSFFLSFVLVFMMMPVIPASAIGFYETPVIEYTDTSAVSSWSAHFSSLISALDILSDIPSAMMWEALDNSLTNVIPGAKSSVREVISSVSGLNTFWLQSLDLILDVALPNYAKDSLCLDVGIGFDDQIGVFRPYDKKTGLPIVNSVGQFPYYKPTTSDPDTGEEVEDPALGGKWVRVDKVSGYKNVINEATLNDLVVALATSGESIKMEVFQDRYKGIQSKTRFENGIPFVYCDSQSRQYVMLLDENQWAVDDSNDYYTGTGGDDIYNEGDTENNTLIDIDTNTAWFPDGTLSFIDTLIYDESTKTYYVDAHQEYDIDNNTYITNNYHYEYHIDYTSITYIGQTEEYNKTYELYYQLPDGRSSADLTAEELLALNTQIDVLPYIRSADDTSIRALYHFDGDTRDSSYWSHLGEFKWNKGASITYMDAGAFEGALYLDENEHDFSIMLPGNIGASDFTLQFRYYQSHTLTPVSDSYITIGGDSKVFLRFDGDGILRGSGTKLSDSSVGSWQELAVMRSGHTVYWYHNGVVIGSASFTDSLGDEIRFVFGDQQQTYKYFDEFRFVNKCIYSVDGYTPASVPHDTNLALVLPDSQLPVADEYWSISEFSNLLPSTDWLSGVQPDTVVNDRTYHYQDIGKWKNPGSSFGMTLQYFDGFTRLMSQNNSSGLVLGGSYGNRVANGLFYTFWYDYQTGWPPDKDYTFTVWDVNGNPYSHTFNLRDLNIYSSFGADYSTSSFDWGYLHAVRVWPHDGNEYYGAVVIRPNYNTSFDFVHVELVEGTQPKSEVEFISSVVVMDKDDLNTPSLAVRTDLDITGHQIGGVRPSLPEKGLVWAMVESGRITSLQIYNGQAWEQVDGRIWTGARWVPYYAYDLLLLKDLYDIVESDPSLDYIYTEAGFWKWLQNAWGEMMKKLDQIITLLGGTPGTGTTCEHVYDSKITREPGCVEPGNRTYTCSKCQHTYVELIDATGHDWIVTNSVPDVLDEDGSVVEEGYDELTCSVCDTVNRDYGAGPEEVDLFDALGDFIADGITWILDKLTELADSLRGITEIFNSFRDKIAGMAGGFPLFFAGFVALLPEDLMAVFWFAVIGFIILAVWKKWSN